MAGKKQKTVKKKLDMASHDLKFRTLGMTDRVRRMGIRVLLGLLVFAALAYTAILMAK